MAKGILRLALVEPDSDYRWSRRYWRCIASAIRTPTPCERGIISGLCRILLQGGFPSAPHRTESVYSYQLFELLDRRIVVAVFDSIDRNDCFNYCGTIPRAPPLLGTVLSFA